MKNKLAIILTAIVGFVAATVVFAQEGMKADSMEKNEMANTEMNEMMNEEMNEGMKEEMNEVVNAEAPMINTETSAANSTAPAAY